MLEVFYETLTPMLTLFLCIAIGFTLGKTKVVPKETSSVLAKVLTWAIMPALSFSAMAKHFTVERIGTNLEAFAMGGVVAAVVVSLSLLITHIMFKGEKSYERGVYNYALAFANYGYVGDPIVIALFGDIGYSCYKIAVLPISILVYTWGMAQLVPGEEGKGGTLKKLLNPPMIGVFVGMIVGISGLGGLIYSTPALNFLTDTLSSLGGCMGPIAMLIAGLTVARYDIKSMFKNVKVYVATFLRLIILPAIIMGILIGIRALINLAFGYQMAAHSIALLFFATAAPLGLNTVVFPEAYGGDASTGAAMAMISHTLCVITIPIMFALLTYVLGGMPVF